jgi:hypothetical protein
MFKCSHSEQSRGCNAATDEVLEAGLSTPDLIDR